MSPMSETASSSLVSSRRFGDLRGVQWRIDLGILPSSSSASIDDLRRVTANSRRSYAALRKHLLVDPHLPKDGSNSPDLVMDNPLSQNPDSMWSRFFKNAELERMVDQDLTRLYPERGGYFQTSGCQVMLRRILLLWCLNHPEYGYRQGMHELLAPLLYVLHVDVERLSEVRKTYEDHFVDKFDGFSYYENDLTYKFDFKKFSEPLGDGNESANYCTKVTFPSELDSATNTIVLLSDAYGAEGELGVVLSEKFMEHDAYAMFDALLSGMGGAVSMAEFFSPSYSGLHNNPVIDASTSAYHFLSVVDSPLHTHLVELGVEPQYFLLRWLRVLFGREFSLENLLLVWDEIFGCDNTKFIRAVDGSNAESNLGILDSPRGAFISAFAISMILQMRSSLLASDNATACLQKLLNFPEDANLGKMVAKAKSLQSLAANMNGSASLMDHDERKTALHKSRSSCDPLSPRTPLNVVPDSYWEEKWRVLHEEEERRRGSAEKRAKKGWSERVRLLRIYRMASNPSSSKNNENDASVRRNLIDNLSQRAGLDEGDESTNNRDQCIDKNMSRGSSSENFPSSTDQENDLEGSSVASNSPVDENDVGSCEIQPPSSPLPVSDLPNRDFAECSQNDVHNRKISECGRNDGSGRKSRRVVKQRSRSLSDTFQWLWKLGKNAEDGTSDRSGVCEDSKTCNSGRNDETTNEGCSGTRNGETVDQNLRLRNLSQSMLKNIQVIESILGQIGPLESSKDGLVGKGQDAVEELRKISNLLSEM